jgi:2-hydroxychromene-2-carboxylate isomerase
MSEAAAPTLTWYFDYSSPYTYLASTRIEGLCRSHGFALSWKPILVGGIFNTINQSVYEARNTPAKVRYGSKDVVDWARYYGIPFRFPTIFPVNSVKALRGALLAIEAGAISAYSHRVFRAYWAEDRDIADDETLRAIAQEAGLPGEDFLAWVRSPEAKERLRALTDEAMARGAFGSPTFFVEDTAPGSPGEDGGSEAGDMYFGNDRLVLLEDAMRRARLRARERPVVPLGKDQKKEGPEGPSLPALEFEI